MKLNLKQQKRLGNIIQKLGQKRTIEILKHSFFLHSTNGSINVDRLFYDITLHYSIDELNAFENRAKSFDKYASNPIKYALSHIIELSNDIIKTN